MKQCNFELFVYTPCPCHSKKTYAECCQPFHLQKELPKTAELLMRSRYSAYALCLPAYIIATTHPSNSLFKKTPPKREKELRDFCKATKFVNLKIVDSSENESTATVTFIAFLTQAGKDVSFKEKSTFQKIGSKWLYETGTIFPVEKI